jgi:acyl-homoserine lactone acylase PvdQ
VGQSGRPWSNHYGDQIGDWLTVRARPMAFSAEAVERAAKARMSLSPE